MRDEGAGAQGGEGVAELPFAKTEKVSRKDEEKIGRLLLLSLETGGRENKKSQVKKINMLTIKMKVPWRGEKKVILRLDRPVRCPSI